MKFQPTSRNIWAVSLPIIVAGVSETIVEFTDALFLAHYGVVELGAIALADALFEMSIFAVAGLVDGLQIMMGRRAGEDRAREIGKVFNQGFYLLAMVSIVLTIAIKVGSPHLIAVVVSSSAVRHAVDNFLQIFAFAVFFQSVNLAYSAFYTGISRTRVLIGATTVLAVTNIVLDYGLIFGHLGMPELGIRGAAIGSLCAEVSAFVFLTGHVLVRRYYNTYGLFRFGRWDQALAGRIGSISWPVSLEALVETVRWFLFFVIIEQLGESALATTNIVYSCYSIFLIPVDGFSETACTMVSNLIGQRRPREIRRLLTKAISLCGLIVLPLMTFAMVFPHVVVSIFTTDPDIVGGASAGLRIVMLALLVIIPGDIFFNAVAGTGDTGAVLLVELVMTVSILCYAAAAALHFGLPIEFVWFSESIGWLICLSLSFLWLRGGKWKRLRV